MSHCVRVPLICLRPEASDHWTGSSPGILLTLPGLSSFLSPWTTSQFLCDFHIVGFSKWYLWEEGLKLTWLIYDLICYISLFGFALVTAEWMTQIQRGLKLFTLPLSVFFACCGELGEGVQTGRVLDTCLKSSQHPTSGKGPRNFPFLTLNWCLLSLYFH